jgi:ribosome-binding protein aMBF1 (putative translation factor)
VSYAGISGRNSTVASFSPLAQNTGFYESTDLNIPSSDVRRSSGGIWESQTISMAKSAQFQKSGSRIVRARSRRGWNRNQLTRASGTSWANPARYEEGENDPRAGKLLRIAEALGISLDWLLGREGA